jgi:polysaccharide export outer membrane protein
MHLGRLFRKVSTAFVVTLFAAIALGQGQGQGQGSAAPNTSLPPKPLETSVSQVPSGGPPPAGDVSAPVRELTIGIGDLLRISILGAPEYDQEVRVSGNGNIVIGLAGDVHVLGLTTEQAQKLIHKRLIDGGFFADPQVAVFEKEFATQGVSVLGEVQKPGVYPITGPRRLFDVLSLAGGTTPKAGQVVTISSRDKIKTLQNVSFSSDPQRNMEANVDILPGDTVVVSKAGVIYVVGDVKHPMGVIMENGGHITVLQALATAEGANSTAGLRNAKIVRKGPNGPIEVPVDLKKIMQAKAPDLTLQAEDVVFIPTSKAKNVGVRTLESIVSIATGVATYRAVY